MKEYVIKYLDLGIIQEKVLIPHSVYLQYMQMPYETKEEQSVAKKWLKNQTNNKEWFTDRSPLFEAIKTGILICNGIKCRVEIILK